MEDGASPSHLRCSLCWIPRTEQPRRDTVGLRLLDSELPWMVGTERSKNRQGMLWTTGRPESSKPRQWILKLGKAFLEASVCMWKMFPHGLIVNPWFSAGVLKNYESFRGWSLTGEGPWGLLAQPHSLFSPCSGMGSEGCWLYALPAMAAITCPPWQALCLQFMSQKSPPSLRLFSPGSFVPWRNITKTRSDFQTHFGKRQPKLLRQQ